MLRLAVPLLIAVTLGSSVRDPKPVMIIVPQADAPVEITSYKAYYTRGGTYTRQGINHDLKFVSKSTKKIVAIRFGLAAFDVFDRFIDYTGGISMEDLPPGKEGSGGWVSAAYSDFAFLTGIAYVDKVRFEDGTIWAADRQIITQAMQKIESDFDAKALTDKPRGAAVP